jgi:xylulokinase
MQYEQVSACENNLYLRASIFLGGNYVAYLMGIDVGTTNCKAAAYDYQGQLLAVFSHPTITHYLENSWAEFNPDELWAAVAGSIKDIVTQLGGAGFDGIAVASMCGTGVLLDSHGQWLHPIIAWFDTRTNAIAEEWKARLGADRVFKITGINPNSVAGITKIQWIQKNYPDAFRRATRWLQIQDFISYKLTGQAVVDYSAACRSMAFDLNKLNWSEEILEVAGISPNLLSRVVPAGTLIGTVTSEVENLTGIKAGTPVFAGGIDYVCGAFATGVIDTGQALNSTGTSEQILVITDKPEVDPQYLNENFTCVTHVVNNKFYMMGMIVSSGATLEWFKQQLGRCSFNELMAEAAAQSLGANGAMLVPHFRGRYSPGVDAVARGAFVGLTTALKRGDIVRSILEGLCYEMVANINGISAISQTETNLIYAIGGATNSDFWLQMKADVTGITIKSKEVHESAALGAAMLAGLGAGVYSNAVAAIATVSHPEKTYIPNPANHAKYRTIYSTLYQKLYPALAEINRAIAEIQYNIN